jgi:hypothetical protein
MDVQISEITSTVRTTDGNSALSPTALQQIVSIVLRAVEQREQHKKRVDGERKVTSGIRNDMEGE